jgi:hypothetical protein
VREKTTLGRSRQGAFIPNQLTEINMNGKPLLASAFLLAATLGTTPSVSAKCVLYEHRDFAGALLVLEENEHAKMIHNRGDGYYYRPDWNDRISSYKMSANCTLFMWEHVDRKGWMLTRTGQLDYIGDKRNDKVSEAKCSCSR